MDNVLITGITGFVGSHLVEHLQKKYPNQKIHGLVRWRSPRDNIKHLDNITFHEGDLHDLSSLISIVDNSQCKHIYHLAAQSFVPYSWNAPIDTFNTNVQGTINLLEAIREINENIIIHICSSSEVYGSVSPAEVPINEKQLMRPLSPYGVSKATKDMLANCYYQSYGLNIITTRAFTHSGARRGSVFVDSSFARQIALMEVGKQELIIKVGNLNSIRTFCDVRDVVRGYASLINDPYVDRRFGKVYNIGGIETMSINEMLNQLLSLSKIKDIIEIKVDKDLLRPTDVTLQIPDISKIKNEIGWSPSIDYVETLKDMLNFWRDHV